MSREDSKTSYNLKL